jgi:hypothetical protein
VFIILCDLNKMAVDLTKKQCCGSGSGFRCLFDPRIRDQRWKKSGSGSGIRNLFDPGYGMKKFGPGINIPDPQYRKKGTVPIKRVFIPVLVCSKIMTDMIFLENLLQKTKSCSKFGTDRRTGYRYSKGYPLKCTLPDRRCVSYQGVQFR